jgi:hypothetical protein
MMLSTMDGSMLDQVIVGGSTSLANLIIHAVLVGAIVATVRRLRMEGGSFPSFLRYTLVIVATGTLLWWPDISARWYCGPTLITG